MMYTYIFTAVLNALAVLLWVGVTASGIPLSTPQTLLVAANAFIVYWCVKQLTGRR